MGNATRAVITSNRRITDLTADVIAGIVAGIGPLWHGRHQARLVSRQRKRAIGAGAKHQLVFVDRLLATQVHLRHGATHDVLACLLGVERSTITRAVAEVRPLLAERGVHHQLRCAACEAWPKSSISARPGRPASSTAPRFGSAARPRRTQVSGQILNLSL